MSSFVRPQISEEVLLKTLEEVTKNVGTKIQRKGRGVYVSHHEALGIITEEYKELIDAVQSNNPVEVASEMMDVAVGAIWGLASMLQKEADIKEAAEELDKLMSDPVEDPITD